MNRMIGAYEGHLKRNIRSTKTFNAPFDRHPQRRQDKPSALATPPRVGARASTTPPPAPPPRRPAPAARAARARAIPDSETTVTPAGISPSSANVRSTSTLKSRRSRLLIPIRSAPPSSARLSSVESWTSTSTSSPSPRATSRNARSSEALERGDDQQHRIRAGGSRLIQLVGVDDEVLAQHRQLARRARGVQILERAFEVGPLGQHRQRIRAAALVRASDLREVGVLAQLARRGRASLELGDHADLRPAQRVAQASLAPPPAPSARSRS